MAGEYDEAVQKLIEKYEGVIGFAASGIAKKNDAVNYEDDDFQSFDGGREDLDELVKGYEDTIGRVATRLAKNVLTENLDEDQVPERLRD